MSSHPPQGRDTSSIENDIDPGLLRNTQSFLECRRHGLAPSPPLIEAWEQFYMDYDPVILRLALACGAPVADLADCVQEIWTTLVARLGEFRYDPGGSRFVTWLYRLVQSKAVDLVRQRTRHPTENLSHQAEAELLDPNPDPALVYEQHRQQALVREVLDRLQKQVSKRSYRVLHMYWIEGRTTAEIVAALEMTPEQVWMCHYRTKGKLYRLFKLHMGDGAFRGAGEEPV